MNTLLLLSHMSLIHFKPLNLFKHLATTQTAEAVVKPQINKYEMIFRSQA